jgi:hypothetical protein
MSHIKRGDVIHTRVMSIKITELILGTKIYDRTDQIDVTFDIHVKVSHISAYDVTHSLVVPT